MGGGGRNSSLNTPFPSLVCAFEGRTRPARNPSSLLVIPLSSWCFLMSVRDLVSCHDSAKLRG